MTENKHYVYMVKCGDESLYTGYTNNIENRLEKHNKGNASKYTRSRLPVRLVYFEEFDDKAEAMKREYRIKQLKRKEKLNLIKG